MGDLCSRCGASVIWATTPKGKRAPYDVELVDEGVRFILTNGDPRNAIATKSMAGHPLHILTCPNRPKKRAKASDAQGKLFDV